MMFEINVVKDKCVQTYIYEEQPLQIVSQSGPYIAQWAQKSLSEPVQASEGTGGVLQRYGKCFVLLKNLRYSFHNKQCNTFGQLFSYPFNLF